MKEEGGIEMSSKTEKRQLEIFVVITYGIPYLMGILMWYGSVKQINLSAFPNTQMLYPAMGVMFAFLLTRRKDTDMPRAFYRGYILITLISIVITVLSVLFPDKEITMPGGNVSVWLLGIQIILIIGNVLCLVCLLAAGKKKRAAYGLRWKKGKATVCCILIFLGLYFLRAALGYVAMGQFTSFLEILKSPMAWITIATLPLSFALGYIAFFGEEYGWRYYLQPILQKRFGARKGVLILGVVWGIWHLPLDFFFYVTPDKGVIMTISQIITCVGIGIFMGYVYMKTENIWAPVIVHFLNNNLALVISGEFSADVLMNQSVSWGDIPIALLTNGLLFGLFIFAKQYREKPTEQ
jgi:membrane protease YdiL (CAAX protease family)